MHRKGAIRSSKSIDRNYDSDLNFVYHTTSPSDDGDEGLSCYQTMNLQQSRQEEKNQQKQQQKNKRKKKQLQRQQHEKQQQQQHEKQQERQPQEQEQEQEQLQLQQQECKIQSSEKEEERKNHSSYYASKIRKKSSIIIDINSDENEDEIYNNSDNDKRSNRKSKTTENISMKRAKQPDMFWWWSSSFMQHRFLITVFCGMLFGGVAFKRHVRNNHQQVGIFDNNFKYVDIYHEYITMKNERENNKLYQSKLDEELQSSRKHNMELEKEQITMKKELESNRLSKSQLENELEFMRQNVFESIHERKKNEQMLQNIVSFRNEVKRNVQDFSRTMLLSKYGAGPYYAEIIVEFHPESNVVRERGISNLGSVIIEIAPIDEMPHTVYWFLEQVTGKSYDDRKIAFHINDDNIIQAGTDHDSIDNVLPKTLYTNTTTTLTGDNLSDNLNRKDLAKIMFQEYSPDYTHKPYTLGLPGKSVGKRLDFYISVKDNTIEHGPGGHNTNDKKTSVITGGSRILSSSSNNDLHFAQSIANAQLLDNDNILSDDADPCFAKVIHGFHVVDNIHLSATIEQSLKNRNAQFPQRDNGLSPHMMKHNVDIRRISLLNS